MTFEQEVHAHSIAQAFEWKMKAKYDAGASQHGGNIWERPEEYLLDSAIEEAIDQVVYLLTLKQKMLERKSLEAAHV